MTIQTDDFTPAPAKRVISAAPVSPQEEALERALRPKLLQEYVGQAKAREQLEIFIGAARKRGEALDHVLLFGPPGLGKTTLSHIIAAELGVNLRQTSGPVLEKPKDLAALLTNWEKTDVLFIDEIHRLSPVVEEILYPALEDYQIDIMIGEGPAARSIKLDLQPFTLVGATTRALQSFAEPIVLIAGGLGKGADFTPLAEVVRKKVKKLVLIGEAAGQMEQQLAGAAGTARAATMEKAVELASRAAEPGDVVLLSPACASFDMFKDYADRGRAFVSAVEAVTGERKGG